MENLIKELIERLEAIKREERSRVLQYQQIGVDDAVRILAGKILALDFCINELYKMVTYARQGEIHH
jgi:hypothetical protein